MSLYKYFLIFIFSGSIITSVQAQYQISGSIVDGETGDPVPFANVALYPDDEESVLQGSISNADGKFTLQDVPEGEYDLEIKFVGYRAYKMKDLQATQPVELGTIEMNPAVQELDEVVVEGKAVSKHKRKNISPVNESI